MASYLLLPGFGGQYTSAVITALTAGTAGADTLDCSRCAQLAVTLGSASGQGTVQLQSSFANHPTTGLPIWTNMSTGITIVSGGVTALYDVTDGPFGIVRFTTSLVAGTTQVFITGFPVQRMF